MREPGAVGAEVLVVEAHETDATRAAGGKRWNSALADPAEDFCRIDEWDV
jgi:hypothetical protein